MNQLVTITLRGLVSMLVIVSVSICCCQAQVLTHGLTASGSACSPVGDGHGCCSGGGEDSEEPRDQPSAPGGCKMCCIKGSGLKHASFEMPVLVAVLPPPIAVETLPFRPAPRVITPDTPSPRLAPPTLLRQRCALIV